MPDMLKLYVAVLIVSLFYGVSITMLSYTMPADTLQFITINQLIPGSSNSFNDIAQKTQASLQKQIDAPLIELGALLVYSGNIIVDMLFNTIFAIPEMMGLLLNGIMLLFGIDSFLFAQVTLFFSVCVTALYAVGLIQLLTSVRSGQTIN